MFCGHDSAWGGWFLGTWFMPGLLLVFVGLLFWIFQQRKTSSNGATMDCPACSGKAHSSYFRCPHCGEALKHHCPNCSKVMQWDWAFCPYCREDQAPLKAQAENASL